MDVQDAGGTLRVAVVGAGPAGIYVGETLLAQQEHPVRIDVYDRLPTPFGLLRYGVAPDHLKMKSLSRVLQRTLDDPRVRFVGNVDLGRDVTVSELRAHYHAVVYSFGSATDRRLGVPGEELPGSTSATRFVYWYCGHPDVPVDAFSLDASTAVVVGVGNVAVDVARILLRDVDELRRTDIPAPVLEVLAASRVTDVHVLGRRSPAAATWTHKELRELGELSGVEVLLSAPDVQAAGGDVTAVEPGRNMKILAEWCGRAPSGAHRRLHLHFWSRPVEIRGTDGVSSVAVERTALGEDGRVTGTGDVTDLPGDLVLRSVGYRGVAPPGVPFDEGRGVIPSVEGRVARDGEPAPGEYVCGWIGRGATGVLGTNRHHAHDVVPMLLADAPGLLARGCADGDLPAELSARGVAVVDKAGWAAIDAAEIARGGLDDRPRAKLATWEELVAAGTVAAGAAATT